MVIRQYQVKATVRHLARVQLCVVSFWLALRAGVLRRAVSYSGRPMFLSSGQSFSVGRRSLRTLWVPELAKACEVQQFKLRFSNLVQYQSSVA